jgi:hypothetical protein
LVDTVKVTVTAAEKRPEKHVVVFDCHCVNQKGDEVITGSAQVIAPTEKVRRPRVALPEVQIRRHDRYGELIKQCADLEPSHRNILPLDPFDRLTQNWSYHMRQQRRQRTPLAPAPRPAPRQRVSPGLPTSGYALIVDGQVKSEFKKKEGAEKAARELKRRFPMLQIKVYDAEAKSTKKSF